MNGDFILPCEFGFLRPLKIEDIHERYVSGLNDPRVNRYLVDVRRTQQTRESVEKFVRMNFETESAILFGIWMEGQPNHCGTVRLHEINQQNQTAAIGTCIFDPSVWKKGVGHRSIHTVTRWGFEVQKLRYIEAGMYSENVGSEKTFRRAGYKWAYDIDEKYLFEGRPSKVKIYVAKNPEVK